MVGDRDGMSQEPPITGAFMLPWGRGSPPQSNPQSNPQSTPQPTPDSNCSGFRSPDGASHAALADHVVQTSHPQDQDHGLRSGGLAAGRWSSRGGGGGGSSSGGGVDQMDQGALGSGSSSLLGLARQTTGSAGGGVAAKETANTSGGDATSRDNGGSLQRDTLPHAQQCRCELHLAVQYRGLGWSACDGTCAAASGAVASTTSSGEAAGARQAASSSGMVSPTGLWNRSPSAPATAAAAAAEGATAAAAAAEAATAAATCSHGALAAGAHANVAPGAGCGRQHTGQPAALLAASLPPKPNRPSPYARIHDLIYSAGKVMLQPRRAVSMSAYEQNHIPQQQQQQEGVLLQQQQLDQAVLNGRRQNGSRCTARDTEDGGNAGAALRMAPYTLHADAGVHAVTVSGSAAACAAAQRKLPPPRATSF